MRTRDEIRAEIQTKRDEIVDLRADLRELLIEDARLCDEKQWYKEDIQIVTLSKRPKKTRTDTVGRYHWTECFIDEDTGEKIPIDRSREVMRNGVYSV